MSKRISVGGMSETWPAPPREGVDALLMLERSLQNFVLADDPATLDFVEADVHAWATLGPPFRQIVEVRKTARVLEVLQERFVGLSGSQLLSSLSRHHRLLPLDVWLGLADALCRALSSLPGKAHVFPGAQFFGIDLRRRLHVFRDPNHSITLEARRLEHLSPEGVRALPLVGPSHVFSLATLLVPLLTGDRPFVRESDFAGLEATRAGDAHWRAANHPDCSTALAGVLTRAMAAWPEDRFDSLEVLRVQLLEAAGCAPATPERVGAVVLGVDREFIREALVNLKAEPALLPPSWRGGGIEVLEDSLLESLVSIDQLPVSRAPTPPRPRSRVNLVPQPPAVAPRVNLIAPGGPGRRPWWQALWPFGRT